MPQGIEEIGQRMQVIQEQTETALRPLLAKQFRAMAVCMENGGSQDRITNCIKGAQSRVQEVQSQLDRVVQSFGQSMQLGMQKCQADAQQYMASGGVEKGLGTIFYTCKSMLTIMFFRSRTGLYGLFKQCRNATAWNIRCYEKPN